MADTCARCGRAIAAGEKSVTCSRCGATQPNPAWTTPFSEANVPTLESTSSSGGSLSENKKYAIVILNGEDPGRVVPIEKPRVVIGRSDCDIVINDAELSRQHVLVAINGTSARIEDLGSTNGTKVAGELLPQGEKRTLEPGVTVSFGGFEMSFSMPGEQNKTQAALSGRTAAIQAAPTVQTAFAWLIVDDEEYALEPGKHTFGRRSDNDIVISDPYVSGHHGEIEVDETGVYLTDTGSSNGTVLNDAKLAQNQKTQLQKDDVIKLGDKVVTIRFKE